MPQASLVDKRRFFLLQYFPRVVFCLFVCVAFVMCILSHTSHEASLFVSVQSSWICRTGCWEGDLAFFEQLLYYTVGSLQNLTSSISPHVITHLHLAALEIQTASLYLRLQRNSCFSVTEKRSYRIVFSVTYKFQYNTGIYFQMKVTLYLSRIIDYMIQITCQKFMPLKCAVTENQTTFFSSVSCFVYFFPSFSYLSPFTFSCSP